MSASATGRPRTPLLVRLVPCWLMMPYWYKALMSRLGYERAVVGYGYAQGSWGEVLYVRRYGWRRAA